jgi:hypothetical protein
VINHRRALALSLVVHAVLCALLLFGLQFSPVRPRTATPIEARLVIKKAKNKDHLPRKAPITEEPAKTNQKEKIADVKKIVDKVVTKEKATSTQAKKPSDYLKALATLSQSFAQELAESKPEEADGEVIADATYFDQVYSLIKAAFIVPPHINGPQGRNLQTVVKLYLASDGSLLRIDLVSPSGDEHFDKAVMEGTRRVDNFGLVPLTLQSLVRERGIVVQLCPFACENH